MVLKCIQAVEIRTVVGGDRKSHCNSSNNSNSKLNNLCFLRDLEAASGTKGEIALQVAPSHLRVSIVVSRDSELPQDLEVVAGIGNPSP